MNNPPRYTNKHCIPTQLRNIDDTYIFDATSGLYKPQSCESDREHQRNATQVVYEAPVDIRTRPDWISIGLTALTLIVLWIYTDATQQILHASQWSAVGTIQASHAAVKSADTAAAQLELTQRPWVYVKDAQVSSPLVFDKDGAHVTFDITLHNGGPSPAVGISLDPRIYVFPAQESSPAPVERLCDATKYFGPGITHGLMIFPNSDSPPQRITVELGNDEIAKGAHHGLLMTSPFICVLYRPTFRADGPGYSSAIQYTFWPAIFVGKTRIIPMDRLYMQRTGFFGESAH